MAARYERDDGDLLPQPNKAMPTGRVPVKLADAATLKVKKRTKEPTKFHASEKPKISYSGDLSVTDVPDEEAVEVEGLATVAAAEQVSVQSAVVDEEAVPESSDTRTEAASETHEVPIVKVVGKRNRSIAIDVLSEAEATLHQATPGSQPLPAVRQLTVSAEDNETTIPLDPTATRLTNSYGVVGMQRSRISDRNPHGGTLRIDARTSLPSVHSPVAGWSAVPIVCAVVVGLVVAGVMVGYQLEIEVATGEVMEGYTYRLDALGASLPFTSSR
jgi:hypothetical protein